MIHEKYQEATLQLLSVGKLQSRFLEVLEHLKEVKEIIISHSIKKEKIAVLVPYSHYKNKPERTLGLLKDIGSCVIHEDC